MSEITVVVDISYGDSGKGKIVDYLMKDYDVCIKYSGGPNTGTTVVIDDKTYKVHHLPVGLFREYTLNMIASGVLINPKKLLQEIEYMNDNGFAVNKNNLRISPHCHVITDDHINEDIANETGGGGVGSTKQGIAYCSRDKYSRKGVRLFESEHAVKFREHFSDSSSFVDFALRQNFDILFQSTQGTMLDIEFGCYPWVSTTHNVAGAASTIVGFDPRKITNIVGVCKAYTTYVGTGDHFIAEIEDEQLNNTIAQNGHEYGTTTGRKRKIGWLDIPQLRYACRVNGVSELALTKSDILEGLPVKYCMGYTHKKEGFDTLSFPMLKDLQNYNPIYESHEKFDLLYLVNLLERELEIPVKYISLGKEREEMIVKERGVYV